MKIVKINSKINTPSRWDNYFHNICEVVSSKSPCLSRKIGAILVQDNSIVATGYNGPPRGTPHCGHERIMRDKVLVEKLHKVKHRWEPNTLKTTCPRKILGYESGEGMQWCTAQHAEENVISNAARLGVSTVETTLYINCIMPCKNCFGTLINSGVSEIVIENTKLYDKHTQFLISNSGIRIREFEL